MFVNIMIAQGSYRWITGLFKCYLPTLKQKNRTLAVKISIDNWRPGKLFGLSYRVPAY